MDRHLENDGAASQDLSLESDVAEKEHESLSVGILNGVQSFFARLKEHAIMQRRYLLKLHDMDEVYRNNILGPSGQNDLVHYETSQKEAILAMLYGEVVEKMPERIKNVLEVLEFDGYLEAGDDGYVFSSLLLKDWRTARFRGHHVALEKQLLNTGRQ